MAGKTIAIRLTLSEAQQVRQQLEQLGAAGAGALDKIAAASAKVQTGLAQARVATGQAIANRFAGVQAAPDAGATERRQADAMAAFGQEVDRLRARFVPLVAEQQRYRDTAQEIAAAERAGAITTREATAALRARADVLAQATAATAADAQARVAALREMAADAGRAFDSNAQGGGAEAEQRRAAAMAALGAEVDRLRARFVPLVAEQERYRAGLREIAAAGDAGALSARQVTEALRAQADALARATAAAAGAGQARIAALNAMAADAGGGGVEAEQRRAAAMAALGAETDRLRAKYVPLVAETRRYEEALEEIAAAERASAISAAEAAAARARARDTLVAATVAADANARATGQQRQQWAQLYPQITDVVASLGSGASVMTVLAQQGGQVTQIFGGVTETFAAAGRAAAAYAGRIGIGAVVAGLGLMAVSAERAGRRMEDLTQRARATRDDFAAAGREIEAAAKAMAAAGTIGRADARTAAQAIRNAPGFTGGERELRDLIGVSQDLSRVMGEGVAESAARLARGFNDAQAAAQELASQGFRTLDAATVRSIERLQNQGKAAEATALLLDRVRQATAGADAARTPFEQGMRDLAKAFTGVEQSASEFTKSIGQGLADAFGTGLSALASFIADSKRMFGEVRDIAAGVTAGVGRATERAGGMGAVDEYGRRFDAVPGAAGTAPVSPAARAPGEVAPAEYAALRDRIAREVGIDPELARRLNAVEGVLQANGTWKGGTGSSAVGGFQVLTGTYNDLRRRYPELGPDRTAPENDIRAGLLYYREQLAATKGDPRRGYYGFHDGPGTIGRNAPSPEAQRAADKLLAGYTGTPLQGYVFPQAPSPQQLQDAQTSRRRIDAGYAAARSVGGIDFTRENLRDTQDKLRAAISDPNATPEQIEKMTAALRELQGQLNETLTPQQAFIRGLEDQIGPAREVFEGDRKLAEVRQQIAEIERRTGTQFSPAERRRAEAAALGLQNAEVTKLLANLDQETVNQVKLADAYGRGHAAVADAEAGAKAYATALNTVGGMGGDTRGVMDALTEAYRNQARAAGEAKIAGQTAENRDQLAYLERQTELVGASEEVRSRELALMRARQELVRADIPLEGEHAQAYLASVAAMSEANSRLSRMNEAFGELQNIGTQAFDRIGAAITDAFVTGGAKAVDFKGIVKGILSEIVQYIARMAILNPVMNSLFGTNRATFSDLGGVLGGMGAGGMAFAGGGAGAGMGAMAAFGGADPNGGQGQGGISGIFGQVKQLGQAQSTFRSLTGGGNTTGFGALDGILNYQLVSGGQTAATNAALSGLGGQFGPATASQVTAAAGGYVPSGITVGGALGGAAAIGGGIYSAISGFQKGGAGGIAQGVTGVAGTAIAGAGLAAGAGLLGSGALAAGAAAAGPYAPLVIAAGMILSQVLGGPKPNPYATTSIDAVGGRLAVGRTDAQLIDTKETIAAAQQAVQNFNQFLDAARVDVLPSTYYESRNPNRVFGIGEKVTGFEQAKDFEGGVPQLRFRSEDPNLNKVLEGRGFGSSREFTEFVTSARVEIDRLKETLAALRDPLRDPEQAGNLRRALDALNKTYDDARVGAEKYGLSIEGLAEAQGKAQEAVIKAMLQEVDDAQEAIRIRGVTARGEPQQAELYSFDLNAEQQKRQWRRQMLDLWGTAFETTDAYRARMTALEDTLGAERLAIVRKYAEEAAAVEAARAQAEADRRERVKGLAESVNDLWARLATANGDPQAGELMQFEIGARRQWDSLSSELIATFGESFRQTEDFAARMALLERTLDAERTAIVQKYAEQATAAERQAAEQRLAAQQRAEEEAARMREQAERDARDAATGVLASLTDYARSLRTGDRNPASPLARYDDASREFQAVSGAAAAGDFRSASELSGYADTLLAASREINGSGARYAADFGRVQQALQGVADVRPDVLTASAAAEQTREQTQVLRDALSDLRAEVVALRREIAQQARAA